jgi:NDP-sugar pyrophosphorylase family protein/thiamine kinase-like enzyme
MTVMEESKHTVLITTSGTGNRLGNLTQYTNKSLVRLGKKPAISYIIEKYPDDTEFVITTGYYGNHIEQFVKLVYPEKNIKFCPIDKYEGQGSSLLYSMYRAKDFLQKPFIFHACDSIVTDSIPNVDGNWCLSSLTNHSEHYRTHKYTRDNLHSILEKGSIESNIAHIGIVRIQDYELFWTVAKSLLEDFVDDTSLSDCHVINAMLKRGIKFKTVGADFWYDVGNVQSLKKTREKIYDKFDILDKDDESIFIWDDKFVVKFFSDKKTASNRVERLNHLHGHGPKLLGQTDNFYKYEFIKGREASKIIEPRTFLYMLFDMFGSYWKPTVEPSNEFFGKTKEFYFDKTISRVQKFLKNNDMTDEPLSINGEHIPKFEELINKVPIDVVCSRQKYSFHGDFVLDNIILTPSNEVKFIDWRQDFCGDIDGGDIYYDLAKLSHSLTINHDLIFKNQFVCNERTGDKYFSKYIELDILRKNSLVEFENVLNDAIVHHNFNLKKVNLIKALIWLNMSPLHSQELGVFLYYFGLYHLNKYLNEL